MIWLTRYVRTSLLEPGLKGPVLEVEFLRPVLYTKHTLFASSRLPTLSSVTMKFFTILSALLIAVVSVNAVAPDADSACRCPKNCSHKNGSSCKFYKDGNVLDGSCGDGNGGLTCQT